MRYLTESLEIRPFLESDREAAIDLFTDPLVKKTYMLPDFASRDDAGKLFERMMELSNTPGRYVAAISLEGNCIGMVNETGKNGDKIEVGYAILPGFHGFGYATEMLRGCVLHLFGQGFREVIAAAFEENPASIRVMIKSGMTQMDLTEQIEYRGAIHRCVYYHIIKEEK